MKIIETCEKRIFFFQFHFSQKGDAEFYIESDETAETLKTASRRVKSPQGVRLVVYVNRAPAPITDLEPANVEVLKQILSKRYNAASGLIDLSNFNQDPGILLHFICFHFGLLTMIETFRGGLFLWTFPTRAKSSYWIETCELESMKDAAFLAFVYYSNNTKKAVCFLRAFCNDIRQDVYKNPRFFHKAHFWIIRNAWLTQR